MAETTHGTRPTGMTAFIVVLVGQIFSLLGTTMTHFGLTLWVYEQTNLATPLAIQGALFTIPMMALGPFVGTLVDRSNRKLMMMLSDLANAAITVFLIIMYTTGGLQIWHLYITAAVAGIFQSFQWPAYSSVIALMLRKEDYARANAMLDTAGMASGVFGPLLAGALIGPIGLLGLFIIDIVSVSFAVGTLLFVRIPQPPQTEAGKAAAGSFFKEALYGFSYIFQRPSLLGLQFVFLFGNLFVNFGYAVTPAMVLARSGNDELVFGTVQSAGAIGGVIGGLVMSAWGGTKRRVHGVFLGWALSGLLGMVLFSVGRALPVWAVASFAGAFIIPFLNGSNQAIWQAKVPPDIQGRVFGTRRLIAWLVSPLAQFAAGPLADRVLEPAMAEGGSLTGIFGPIVGTGPGTGMALMFLFGGLLAAVVGFSGYLFPATRNAESLLPDHAAVMTKETSS